MKFATKLVLGTTIIISVLFSVGGTILIRENFKVSYNQAVEQNVRAHILYRYSFESGIRTRLEQNNELTDEMLIDTTEKMVSYGKDSTYLGVIKDEELIYCDFSESLSDAEVQAYYTGELNDYLVKEQNHRVFMYLASKVQISGQVIKLMNVYDLTALFEERDRQTEYYIKWFLVLLLVSMAAMMAFSKIITAPIKRLNEGSKQIAQGNYGERTEITTADEIGELSRSFDSMANAVEVHIQKLQEDVKNREAFISDFSHELKTPMTSMMGYSKLLLRGNCESELQQKCAGYIYSECRRLEILSRKLLRLMEIDSEPIVLTSVSTEWLKEKIELIMQPFLEAQEIVWRNDWESCYLKGDGQLLLDYLKNVVENGIRASNETPVITIIGKREKDKYSVTVTDCGCGMTEEEIRHVCAPFYMADKSRAKSQGRTGLGLSICSKIAAVHHSHLEIQSEPGRGTSITIELEVEHENEEMV